MYKISSINSIKKEELVVTVQRIDYRASIKAKPGGSSEVLGKPRDGNQPSVDTNILQPLYAGNGVIYPYTPIVSGVGGTANYEEFEFTHTNYKQHVYKNSTPNDITVTGDFTAQTEEEAKYLLAVMFFFRSVTKSYFGQQQSVITRRSGEQIPGKSGLPPPVLLFNYLGSQMFKNIPVVVKDYTYELLNDVDYIPVVRSTEDVSYVPTKVTITVVMGIQQNPFITRTQFNLDKFKRGGMLDRGFI